MNFRNDINGLRAIAILAVVVFHFFPGVLKGGFAGVDVFFVISGYLMTGIILRGYESNKFSYIDFYYSRLSRIAPGLLVLCLFLFITGWFLLAPWDFRALGKHVLSSILFFSNYVYLAEAGSYFEAQEYNKFLLHTWSLSVEFQFYFVFPMALMVFIWLFGLKNIKYSICVLLFVGLYCSFNTSYQDPKSAFYLMPFRFWEFAFGSLAFVLNTPGERFTWVRRYIPDVGMLLILASYLLFDETAVWPGYKSLLPVVGTFLIIWIGAQEGVTGYILSRFRLFQWLGTISYSWYLWHWPFSVYVGIVGGALWGLGLSLLCAWISYQFIEKGTISWLKRNRSYILFPAAACTVTVAGLLIFKLNGIPERPSITPMSSALATQYRYCDKREPENVCIYPGKEKYWAVLGDSHSLELAEALSIRLSENSVGLMQFSMSGCVPGDGVNDCTSWTDKSIKEINKNTSIDSVVVVYRLAPVVLENSSGIFESLERNLTLLAQKKESVYFLLPIPDIGREISTLYMANRDEVNVSSKLTGLEHDEFNNKYAAAFDAIKRMNLPGNVFLVNPSSALCDKNSCYAIRNNEALYFDGNHLSVAGAKKVANLIL